MKQAREELHGVLSELQPLVILVLANKQDLPNAMTVEEVYTRLDIPIWDRNLYVKTQPTIATTGHGLFEGLAWMDRALNASDINQKYL